MKKIDSATILIILIVVFVSFSCNKEDDLQIENLREKQDIPVNYKKLNYKVSVEEANIFARNFFKTHFTKKAGIKVKKAKKFALPLQNKKLYLIEIEPEGFILMSDDKRNIPVLAFSEKGNFGCESFDELPVGAKEWISETLLMNHALEKNKEAQKFNDIESEWRTYLNNNNTEKIIINNSCNKYYLGHVQNIYDDCLLTTNWHQYSPYNLEVMKWCSVNQHAPAGCVAVAMAQIMNYWHYPNNYNWSIMQNAYLSNSTTTSAYEVADLLKDIGNAADISYGCDGSGTTSRKAKNAFVNDFGYSSSIVYDDYQIDPIKQNLKCGYPVMLGGYRTYHNFLNINWYTDGHQWVCDGLWEEYDKYKVVCTSGGGVPLISYETRNYRYYLHMNWGWDNYYNEDTWYYSNELTHPVGYNENYKYNKDMIINIHP